MSEPVVATVILRCQIAPTSEVRFTRRPTPW